jgi:hypothetical protein
LLTAIRGAMLVMERSMTADEQTYAFDNALAMQRERLDMLEALFDPGTARHLDALEVAPGWRCLEVGAGGGSIAASLCDRVAHPEPRERFERMVHAHNEVLAARHVFDPFYGRSVRDDLEAAGLVDTGSEGRTAMWRGGGPGGRVWQLTIAQIRDEIVQAGLMSAVDVDAALALCDDPSLVTVSPMIMAAWGRRPV